jgi:TonB family protein
MNRVQKKCFVFSVGLHGLLAIILIGSAAFRNRAEETDMPILTLVPANILDKAGVSGGEPAPAARASQAQAQPAPRPRVQTVAPQARTEPQVIEPKPVRHVEHQKPLETEPDPHPEKVALAVADTPSPKPAKPHHQHEIQPTFTPVSRTTNHGKTEAVESSSQTSAQASARSEAKRLAAIENSLNHLASGVQTSAAAKTVVDVPGVGGGGEVFAGYREMVYNAYYRAWIAPENGVKSSSLPEVKISVARDGSIISAELISPSGEASLDKSVLRALQAVTKLPPFPATAHDTERTFRIRFSLDLKEATG